MNNKVKIIYCVYLLLLIAFGYGYVRCAYRFVTSDFEPSYKREIVYGFGTFTGTGVVIGWFDFEDTKSNIK